MSNVSHRTCAFNGEGEDPAWVCKALHEKKSLCFLPELRRMHEAGNKGSVARRKRINPILNEQDVSINASGKKISRMSPREDALSRSFKRTAATVNKL